MLKHVFRVFPIKKKNTKYTLLSQFYKRLLV